jgi:tetratricopeptide (TPR) repeat protein
MGSIFQRMKPFAIFCLFCLGLSLRAGAIEVPAIIERNYEAARSRYQTNPTNHEAAWQLGRACFDRAEYSRDDDERAAFSREGSAACQQLIDRDPACAPAHYYMAMDLAQLARTKKLGALPLLGRMEKNWEAALALDRKMDYAGPDRYLGMLYRDAPGWPLSLGSKEKARQHLVAAVELSPQSPENRLTLIETYLQWGEQTAAAKQAAQYRAYLPAARKEFSGEYWNESWKDWDSRWATVQRRLREE